MSSPHAALARERKAGLLAGVIAEASRRLDESPLAAIDAMTDSAWSVAESCAGTRPASATTRARVREILAGLVALREVS